MIIKYFKQIYHILNSQLNQEPWILLNFFYVQLITYLFMF